MASILTLDSSAAKNPINVPVLSGELIINGTAELETFVVPVDANVKINAGGEVDVIKFVGGASEYSVHSDGTDVLFTNKSSGTVITVAKVGTSGDQVQFGTTGLPTALKIVDGAIVLGEGESAQIVTTVDAGVTGATGTTGPADEDAPVFISATVVDNTLIMSYSDISALAAATKPDASAFVVQTNDTINDVTAVTVDAAAKTVTLTLATAVVFGETVKVSYFDSTESNDAKAIQDTSGNDAATLIQGAVVNATLEKDDVAPVFVNALAEGKTLTLNYNEALDAANLPADKLFVVQVDGVTTSIDEVAVVDSAVVLTLASAVSPDAAVTVSYLDRNATNDINAIQDASGNDAAWFIGAAAVTAPPNEAPVVDAGSFTVATDGTEVGAVTATDPEGTAVTYAIAEDGSNPDEDGENGVAFSIDPNSGVLMVNDPAELVAGETIMLTVEATDADGIVGTGTVTVEVTEPVEPPNEAPVVDAGSFTVATDGTEVGAVTATDPEGTAVTYAIAEDGSNPDVDGENGAAFTIDANSGALTVNDPAELVAGETITLTVEATDEAGQVGTGTVTVAVTAPDTTAPVITSEATAEVIENQNVLYTATATDDSEPVTYQLVEGVGDAALLTMTDGVVTLADGNLDFDAADAQTSYTFQVTATDSAETPNTSDPLDVTITVTNEETDDVVVVPDTTAPEFTSLATADAIENQSVLYTTTATDDSEPVTYQLVEGVGDAALLTMTDGVVTLADGNLDFDAADAQTSYTFQVTATDSAETPNTSDPLDVTITVTNEETDDVVVVPDTTAPVITSEATAEVIENQNVLYTATATDDSQPVTYSLEGADAALLAIDADGVVTLVDGTLDFDAADAHTSYSFDVVATDSAETPNTSAAFAVAVTVTDDVTDNPTYAITAPTPATVNEGATATFTVATTNVADGELAYTLSGAGIEAADVTGGLTAKATVTAGVATIAVALVTDALAAETDKLVVTLDADTTKTATVDVIDTTPTYAIAPTVIGTISVNEGATASFTVTTTNVANDTALAYALTGIQAEDLKGVDANADDDSNPLTGSEKVVTDAVTGVGTATITVDLLKDATLAETDKLVVTLDADTTKTATLAVIDMTGVYTPSAVTAANDAATPVFDASTDAFSFGITAGTYTYNISGFSDDDQLDFPVGNEASINNSSFKDDAVDLTWASSSTGQTVTIHLSGLATGLDKSLNSVANFNTVFSGADAII
ncbi:hypothetical protein CKO12_11590 [Chromatium okenii]|uniref:SwmB domain-containing protein n=1 Tax=Chromatium okenii TaxID=61644 RepID=UPI0019072C9D|nr:SwmB domain-containing protein [Chromatium okenii]MBK1642509.1 hypothetical protein [Chromatium okenii]